MPKTTSKPRSTRRTYVKLGVLVFSIILFVSILAIINRPTRESAYLQDWAEMTNRTHPVEEDEPDVYFVFTSLESHRIAQTIRPYVDDYLSEQKPVPLYLIDAQAVRGERHPIVNPNVPAQLVIIKDGEVDFVIDGINAIAAILNEPVEATKKNFQTGHIIHWADLPRQTETSAPQVVYIYNVGSNSHEEIAERIQAFNFDNPLDLTLYKVAKNASYGVPTSINTNIFGLPLLFNNPTIVIRVNGQNVMTFRKLEEIIPFLDSVDDGTFEVVLPDPVEDDETEENGDNQDNHSEENGDETDE
ncbi:MAG: hypothetical protein EA374_06890 [Acholeplasmatales bacterium]|nr:MAG: hypothetical protein EA374_06890 [Acholeplasmatales bacterium]